MKKFLLPILLILSSNALTAEAPKVKLGGSIDTQIGYRKQKAYYDAIQKTGDANIGNKLHSGAIVNDTRLNVNVDGNHDGLKYGAVIKLFADTSASSSGNPNHGDKVWAYVETKYGRLEGANTKSASHNMMISGKDVAKATGGYDGTTYYWYNDYVINDLNDSSKNARVGRYFLTSAGLPTFGKNKSSANKLVYYTPKFNGWQLGVSYIIDPNLRGTISQLHTDIRSSGIGFKDVVDASVRYDSKINDVTYGVSLGGEHGKAKNGSGKPDREDMKAWVAGAKAGYKGITIAGSYANWMNTGRPKDKLPGAKFGSKHWTAGIGYDYEKLGISITYMESKEANSFIYQAVAKANQDTSFNKYKIVSFGADYKVASGMVTYAEVSKFKFHRDKSAVNNKGAVILAGTKLNF